jgi:hypothetical protein
MGAQTVIGVDVGSRLESPPDIRDGVDVVQRSTEIMMLHLRSAGRRVCDVLVEPDVTPFTWMDFDRYEDIIQAGEQAARDRLPSIRNVLRRGRWATQILRLREHLAGRGEAPISLLRKRVSQHAESLIIPNDYLSDRPQYRRHVRTPLHPGLLIASFFTRKLHLLAEIRS